MHQLLPDYVSLALQFLAMFLQFLILLILNLLILNNSLFKSMKMSLCVS